MSRGQHSGVDLRRLLEPYWRRRWLVLAIVVVLPAAVYFGSKQLAKTYEASTTLLVRETSVSSSLFGSSFITTGSATDALTLIQTTPVGREAARALDEPASEAGNLLSQISAQFTSGDGTTGSQFITITAKGEDPVRAANVANAFGTAIGATRSEDAKGEIRKTIVTLQQQREALAASGEETSLDALETQLQDLRGLLASQEGATQVVEAAGVPSSPISPQPRRNATLALVVAILIAAGAVPLADALNRRLREADEMEEILEIPLLAQIPADAFPGKVPGTRVHEAFQTLRASLTYFNLDRELDVILVTSPGHEEGKTTVATNLATSLARDGRGVVLIDGDLRKPRAAERLGVTVTAGLEQVLTDEVNLMSALQPVDVGGGWLQILGATGPARAPSILLGSKKMRLLIKILRAEFDLLIIDTPPLLAVSDAIPLLKDSSGALIVGQINRTHTAALIKSKEVIESAGGAVLGAVATGGKTGGLYGGYGDYSDYYVADEGSAANDNNGDPNPGKRLRDRVTRR